MSNVVLEMIYQVLGKLVRTFNISTQTYVDKDYTRTVILATAEFVICSTTNEKKGYNPGQLVFGRDIIIPIKHRVNWELIRQKKKTQINRDNTRENKHRVRSDYKVVDDGMLTN